MTVRRERAGLGLGFQSLLYQNYWDSFVFMFKVMVVCFYL